MIKNLVRHANPGPITDPLNQISKEEMRKSVCLTSFPREFCGSGGLGHTASLVSLVGRSWSCLWEGEPPCLTPSHTADYRLDAPVLFGCIYTTTFRNPCLCICKAQASRKYLEMRSAPFWNPQRCLRGKFSFRSNVPMAFGCVLFCKSISHSDFKKHPLLRSEVSQRQDTPHFRKTSLLIS